MIIPTIRSDGDLEIVLLHEVHSSLSRIIGPDLYSIGGTIPEQTALFRDSSSFDLFLILIIEFFAEGRQSAFIDQKYKNLSLMTALQWFCSKHPKESSESGLSSAVEDIDEWINREMPIEFWCPEVDKDIKFPISNRELVSFGANTAKHHLLRLSTLLGKIEALTSSAGYSFSPQDLVAVLNSMTVEVRSRLAYHSTYLLELLGHLFLALNTLIVKRFAANPTNDVAMMDMPKDVSSDVFRDLYGSVLVFKRYETRRITDYTPSTTKYLKMRYQ
jgi:hypothetical protein